MQRRERQRAIIRAVDSGQRSVAELVELTGISAVTIRRDLAELTEKGAVRRVHGGAAPVLNRGDEYPFGLRAASGAAEKAALARAAASMIMPGMSVLVDNGTTALAVAHELAGKGVTALALSLHAAAALAAKPGNQVIVPGGVVHAGDLAFTGAGAAEAVRAMRFDWAVLGACAADPESGLTVATWDDAKTKRAALEVSRMTMLVSTAEKFTRTAAHRFGDHSDLDAIITTTNAPFPVLHEARRRGAQVVTVPPQADDRSRSDDQDRNV